jgi:hypothetical protein
MSHDEDHSGAWHLIASIHPSIKRHKPTSSSPPCVYLSPDIMFLFLPWQKKNREKPRPRPRPRPFLGSKNVIEIPYLFDRPSETSIFAFEKRSRKAWSGGMLFLIVPHTYAKNFHDSITR